MTQSSKIRRKILKQRGVELEKHTRNPIVYADLPTAYRKTYAMKLMEVRFSEKIENLIFDGTIYEVAAKLSVDPTTISKWRKLIREARERLR